MGRSKSCSAGKRSKRLWNWKFTDMETLREILDPHFLLRNSVYASLLVGFACPLAGVYLVLRRLIFMGVALPQISSAGIAFAFSLPAIGLVNHMHVGHFEG